FGAMPPYADQLTPEDRWKVIAYIRVLQASQNVNASQMSAEDRQKLEEAERKAKAPSGAHAEGREGPPTRGARGAYNSSQTPAPASVPQAPPSTSPKAGASAAPTASPTSGGHRD